MECRIVTTTRPATAFYNICTIWRRWVAVVTDWGNIGDISSLFRYNLNQTYEYGNLVGKNKQRDKVFLGYYFLLEFCQNQFDQRHPGCKCGGKEQGNRWCIWWLQIFIKIGNRPKRSTWGNFGSIPNILSKDTVAGGVIFLVAIRFKVLSLSKWRTFGPMRLHTPILYGFIGGANYW